MNRCARGRCARHTLSDADLVGISAITPTAKSSYLVADFFRARGVPVVIGGPHVTFVPEESLAHAETRSAGTMVAGILRTVGQRRSAAVDLSMTFSRPGTQIVLLRIDVSALPVGARIRLAEALREALSPPPGPESPAQGSRAEGPIV